MEDSRIPHQAIQWELRCYKRARVAKEKLGGRDLKDMDTTWKEAKELATDRAERHQHVAQCIHQDAE